MEFNNMDVIRKPHQIILIEHFFYPLMGLIAVLLIGNYGEIILQMVTFINAKSADKLATYFILTALFSIGSYFYIYGSVRVWFSSISYTKGWKRTVYQAYGVIVFLVAIYCFERFGLELVSAIYEFVVVDAGLRAFSYGWKGLPL